jgi:hypothetical protein
VEYFDKTPHLPVVAAGGGALAAGSSDAGLRGGLGGGAWVPATVLSVGYDERLEPFYTIKVVH